MRWKLSPVVILIGCWLATVTSVHPQSGGTDGERWRSRYDNAVAALQQGRYPEAASLFLEAVGQAEKFGSDDIRLAESLNGLAQVYRFQQKYAEAELRARHALAILERAQGSLHRGVLPSLVNLAGVAQATGRYAEAEEIYRRILSIRWGTPKVTDVSADQVLEKFAEVLTLAYARDTGLGRALEEYWKSISESQLDKDLYVAMRDKLLAVPLVAEAESLMRRATRLHPDSRQLHYHLAEVYVTLGRHQQAIEVLEKAARLGGGLDPAQERKQRGLIYATIAQMNFFLVRFDEAFAALTTALEISPDSTSARLLLGDLYLRRNKLDEAVAEYRRVISASPAVVAAHEGLAQVELALGRYSESANHAIRALEIDPGRQSSRYVKAMALIRQGRDREGRTVLQEYEQRESQQRIEESRSAEIREIDLTSSAMLAQERPQEVIAFLHEGIRSHPGEAALYMKLGLTQSRLRLHREAAETFETMVRLKLDDFLVHRQLSREYEALGNRADCQQHRVMYLQRYYSALLAK
jgi:tetratricopeptide (TPR) repeat protein